MRAQLAQVGSTRRARAVLVVAITVAGLTACGGGGEEPETSATTSTSTTTTTAAAADDAAGDAYQGLLDDLAATFEQSAIARDAAAGDNDLDGAKDQARILRDAFFEFDADTRELRFPPSATVRVNDLLDNDAEVIEALDAYVEVTDVAGYNAALQDENAATTVWQDSANALADELGVDGVEMAEGESQEGPESGGSESAVAGETATGMTFSLEVPEAFTWDGDTVNLVMESDTGARLAINRSPDHPGPLAAEAQRYIDGATAKEGSTVVAGPTDVRAGELPARQYLIRYQDGEMELDIFAQSGDTLIIFNVYGDAAAVDAAAKALTAVLPSFEIVGPV